MAPSAMDQLPIGANGIQETRPSSAEELVAPVAPDASAVNGLLLRKSLATRLKKLKIVDFVHLLLEWRMMTTI